MIYPGLNILIIYVVAKVYKTLGLLSRTFKANNTYQVKKLLYIFLVRSQLLYCSQLWISQDIQLLEHVQRRATKYILNNYDFLYKSHREQLHMLPLMYTYELNDLMFFIESWKFLSSHFDISHITKHSYSFCLSRYQSSFHT